MKGEMRLLYQVVVGGLHNGKHQDAFIKAVQSMLDDHWFLVGPAQFATDHEGGPTVIQTLTKRVSWDSKEAQL